MPNTEQTPEKQPSRWVLVGRYLIKVFAWILIAGNWFLYYEGSNDENTGYAILVFAGAYLWVNTK